MTVRPLTVLIVDESAMLRAMLKRVLQISGVPLEEILEVTTKSAGATALGTRAIDVVFANIDPAQREGYDLLRGMFEHREWRRILRIATSTRGVATVHDAQTLFEIAGVVTTPFRPEAIRDVMAPLIKP